MPYCVASGDKPESFVGSDVEEIPTPKTNDHEVPDPLNLYQDDLVTVIIGAGSIGLWTAYSLAQAQNTNNGKPRKVVVVDVTGEVFGATSATCTGCIHYKFQSLEKLTELGKYSFDKWEKLAEEEFFRNAVGWRESSIYGATHGDGQHQTLLPNWIRSGPDWDINASFLGPRNAMVNPVGVGKWLRRQCEDMGVAILLRTAVTSAKLNERNDIEGVLCEGPGGAFAIKCESLVLAAGPWTPEVCKHLFPSSSIGQELVIDPGDWILLQNPVPVSATTIAFVGLNDIVGEKLEFAGRNDGTIWVCGRRECTGTLPAIGEVSQPRPEIVSELTGRSYRFLNGHFQQNPDSFEELKVVQVGRAFRPSTPSGLPVISSVPARHLRNIEYSSLPQTQEPHGNSRVFLCWGHGAYGIALGPGTGRIMSQIIMGEAPDIDVAAFTLLDTSITSK